MSILKDGAVISVLSAFTLAGAYFADEYYNGRARDKICDQMAESLRSTYTVSVNGEEVPGTQIVAEYIIPLDESPIILSTRPQRRCDVVLTPVTAPALTGSN